MYVCAYRYIIYNNQYIFLKRSRKIVQFTHVKKRKTHWTRQNRRALLICCGGVTGVLVDLKTVQTSRL